MEKREESLRDALDKNDEECERWKAYKKENETAIENLQEFSKRLTVDVMVPIGRKCFMPGQLIHTNEVLVGHYQGYFSKCTAAKAKEICNQRINRAEEQLRKLETEAQLWTNKLKIPHVQGVMPNSEEREIIEDYDENQEKLWREEHKKNLRAAKLKEKQKREQIGTLEKTSESANTEKSEEDIFKMLEEAELMEELEQELQNLEIEEVNDETLKNLMAGEVTSTKPKQRISHESKKTDVSDPIAPILEGVVKKNAAEFREIPTPATNNNNRPNPAIHSNGVNNDDVDDMTEEVRVIKEQAMFLPASDQVGFYEYQVEIVRKKISNLKMTNEQDVEEKLHLLSVKEELEDLLALAEEETLETESGNESEPINDEKIDMIKAEKTEVLAATKKPQKRKVQFALEDDTLLFRRNEYVSQMLPKSTKTAKPKKDIITLDNNVFDNKKSIEPVAVKMSAVHIDKKEQIREKVEKNLEFISHNQSQVDCDLITKIIDQSEPMNRTIYISFKHSTQEPATNAPTFTPFDNNEADFVPEKPSDFYELYSMQRLKLNAESKVQAENFYVNSYVGEEKVKAPILRETNHQASYEDPRSTYSLPKSLDGNEMESKTTKPILRNKSAVERETHLPTVTTLGSKAAKKKRYSDNEDEIMSAYNKVMNDVKEKPLSEPEHLPTGKFINAHAPKKRVSRFKQSRISVGATEQT